MAEAIAALGLAANILQTVEYGGVFVTTAWKIYSSQADANLVKDFDQLRYLTQDLRGILDSLKQSSSGFPSTAGLRSRDHDLLRLVAESQRITEEILCSLDKIGDLNKWKFKKHKAILAAFKLTWNQGHIKKLQTKLDHVRSQLTLHLVHSLRCVCKTHFKLQICHRDIYWTCLDRGCLDNTPLGSDLTWSRMPGTEERPRFSLLGVGLATLP